MSLNSFTVNLEEKILNWYLLMISGICAVLVGMFTLLILPDNNCKTLEILFEVIFAITGLSGTIFSINPLKPLRDWINYLFYTIFIFILSIILSEYLQNIHFFIIGFILLFRSLQFLTNIPYLKQYSFINWKSILFINLTGSLLALYIIISLFFSNPNGIIIICISFTIMGISHMAFALELKKLRAEIPNFTKNE
ncbi:hypothetical protein CMT84_19405 [Elizabethkingia anophelis]|nr:hypothetical protein [Elizabethkingia anophelis]